MYNKYLLDIDYDTACKVPYDNDPLLVAARARELNIHFLDGMGLMKLSVEDIAQKSKINDQQMIDSTTKYIWYSYIKSSQKEEFKTLASKANEINYNKRQINADNLDRICRINTPQITNDPIMDNFFQGTNNFYDDDDHNNNFESSILPSGSGYGTSSSFGSFGSFGNF
ncbi:hypothetical protein C1645_801448 [Glomus cerebriforme]|uniref:Uncharacterized protein n=1 Tax=Glomus cerebriforme TaxID=658196 RepID=A0A397TKZ8_9GLOM|nr:hypothetical protein C1645_801448 [Glomus cerebriforme]